MLTLFDIETSKSEELTDELCYRKDCRVKNVRTFMKNESQYSFLFANHDDDTFVNKIAFKYCNDFTIFVCNFTCNIHLESIYGGLHR